VKWTLRAAALSTFLTALLGAGLFADPSPAEDAGIDFWHVMDDRRRVAAAEETAQILERETEAADRRMALRGEIVRDVADGRLAFEDGARRFAELNRTLTGTLAAYTRERFPGRTDEERAARQLVLHLRHTKIPAAVALADEWECTPGIWE
jgi:hypothetical protein